MVLIDRGAELALLDRALAGCVAGRARIVLVEAAVGCGKSELVDAVAESAQAAGAIVLRALGSAAERSLPLGLIGQLVNSAPPGTLPDPAVTKDPTRTGAMQAFSDAVHELSERAPVVICVDDLHLADDPSCRYLLQLARRARQARILLVLTESGHEPGDDPVFSTELLRQRNFERVRLERLGRRGVAEVLSRQPDPVQDEHLADRFWEISGGNPLLLRALAEEHRVRRRDRSAGPEPALAPEPEPQVGGAFTQAVLACLYRCGPRTTRLAEALAVLGLSGTALLAAHLLGVTDASVEQEVQALTDAGILDGPRFRHPSVRHAVLDRMDPVGRADLHREAARLAHRNRLPASAVAGQLLAAQHIDEDWAVPVLRVAAEQLLADGKVGPATACLELAYQGCTDDEQRAEFSTRLAAVTWQTNPGVAERHLAEPLQALRAGRMAPVGMGPLARLLVAQGRIDEAADALARLTSATGGDGGPTGRPGRRNVGHRDDPLEGLSAFPRRAGRLRTPSPPQSVAVAPAAPAALWAIPDAAQDRTATEDAELFLRGTTLGAAAVGPAAQALRVLLHLGGAARAVHWSRRFADDALRRDAPGWQALFTGLEAEALLRQGDLPGAEERAALALQQMPEREGSIFLSGIAATLVRARVARGRYAAAARALGQPVPESLAGSYAGLGYLRARGQYRLATGRYHAALGDFLEIGRRMKRWGLDRPLLVPWRTDAAEALLQLGEAHQAERFVTDQLATRDASNPWVVGISLRTRAAIREPRERQTLLARSVDELCRSGDRYELTRSMAELSQALKELGEHARAHVVSRRAWHLAQKCGAEVLREKTYPGHVCAVGEREATASPAGYAELEARLSESEKRVATLAVHGHTNREIALKLYVTVSTVEQHLTRVYRKLNISSRQELPVELHLGVSAMV